MSKKAVGEDSQDDESSAYECLCAEEGAMLEEAWCALAVGVEVETELDQGPCRVIQGKNPFIVAWNGGIVQEIEGVEVKTSG